MSNYGLESIETLFKTLAFFFFYGLGLSGENRECVNYPLSKLGTITVGSLFGEEREKGGVQNGTNCTTNSKREKQNLQVTIFQ